MSEEKFCNNHTTQYKLLSDLKLLTWSHESKWSAIITKECLGSTNQLVEQEDSSFINKTVLLGILATLTLLTAAAWIQVPKITQAVQQVGTNSVQELILSNH